jgi:hypothetical protein
MAIAYRSVATATNSVTCSAPSGLTSGDVMVATVAWYDGIAASVTPPSGWTLIGTANPGSFVPGGQTSSKIYWKLATGSEPADYTWTISTGSYSEVGIIAYSGVDTTTPIDASSSVESSGGNVTASSVTTTVANTQLIAVLHDYGNTMSAPSGMTQRALWDASINLIADEAIASTGATGTRADGAAYGAWNAHLIALKPAGGGGGAASGLILPPAYRHQSLLGR